MKSRRVTAIARDPTRSRTAASASRAAARRRARRRSASACRASAAGRPVRGGRSRTASCRTGSASSCCDMPRRRRFSATIRPTSTNRCSWSRPSASARLRMPSRMRSSDCVVSRLALGVGVTRHARSGIAPTLSPPEAAARARTQPRPEAAAVSSPNEASGHHRGRRGHPGRKRRCLDLGRARRRAERRGRDPVVRRDATSRSTSPPRSRTSTRRTRCRPKEVRRTGSDVHFGVAAAIEAAARRRARRRRAQRAIGVVIGSVMGGLPYTLRQQAILEERGWERVSPHWLPEHARRHDDEPRRDAARRPRHELLDRVGLRHRHPRDRRGGGGHRPRPGRRRSWPARPSRRWCRSSWRASARCARSSTAATTRRAASRPFDAHPGRVRDGRGRRRARPRGARAGPGARRADLLPRSSATAPRTTPTTSRRRTPSRSA